MVNVPAGQDVHVDEPVASLNEPEGHGMQLSLLWLPAMLLNLPAGQSCHVAIPSPSQ